MFGILLAIGVVSYLVIREKAGETVTEYPSPSGESKPATIAERIEAAATRAAYSTGVPREWIRATIWLESRDRPDAVGDGGRSFGLMQVQEASYQTLIENGYGTVPNWRNGIEENITVGSRYISWLIDAYGIADAGVLREYYTLGPTKYARGVREPNEHSKMLSAVESFA